MKSTKPAPAPLNTLQLLPARIAELIMFSGGEPMPFDYPKWVRAIGSDLLPYLPPKLFAAAKKDPQQLLWGVLAGFGVACGDDPTLTEIAPEDKGWLERSAKTVGLPR